MQFLNQLSFHTALPYPKDSSLLSAACALGEGHMEATPPPPLHSTSTLQEPEFYPPTVQVWLRTNHERVMNKDVPPQSDWAREQPKCTPTNFREGCEQRAQNLGKQSRKGVSIRRAVGSHREWQFVLILLTCASFSGSYNTLSSEQ